MMIEYTVSADPKLSVWVLSNKKNMQNLLCQKDKLKSGLDKLFLTLIISHTEKDKDYKDESKNQTLNTK